jgi:NAD(P)-dependent dehydrogenase (short-subunit alcohol dehydrogenase family)
MTSSPRIVVITGGTAGVGRATAVRFAREGWKVAVIARGEDGLEGTYDDAIRAGAPEALAIACDVADADGLAAAALRVESELGPIDVWINNAMTTVFAKFDDMTPAEFRRVTEVTYLGSVWGTRAALTHMKARDRGTIVQIGSALAYRSIPLQSGYCGAKHAIHGFLDSLRSELIHEGSNLHLTMVQLPAVNTPQFRQCMNKMPYEPQPVPPIFQPEIIADAVYFAATHKRREVYIAAPTVEAVLGQKVAPGLLDHYMASRAWDGQFTSTPTDPSRPANLFQPVPGDHGAHGVFDDKAKRSSAMAAITTRLGAAGVRTAAVALAGLAVIGGTMLVRRLAARGA